jgi:hypothetical protein
VTRAKKVTLALGIVAIVLLAIGIGFFIGGRMLIAAMFASAAVAAALTGLLIIVPEWAQPFLFLAAICFGWTAVALGLIGGVAYLRAFLTSLH